MSLNPLSPGQTHELVSNELDYHTQLRQSKAHSESQSLTYSHRSVLTEVNDTGRKKERWSPRGDYYKHLMNEAKKRAEQRHASRERENERVGKPGRKPSKAITSRQKSSKKSAEVCRIKMQIYTELLEADLTRKQDSCKQVEGKLVEQLLQTSALNARAALLLEHKRNQGQPKKSVMTSLKSVSPVSFMSEITVEKHHSIDTRREKEQHLLTRGDNTVADHAKADIEDPSQSRIDRSSCFLPSQSESDFMQLSFSPPAVEEQYQSGDDIFADLQSLEVRTPEAPEEEASQQDDSIIDVDEINTCLDFLTSPSMNSADPLPPHMSFL